MSDSEASLTRMEQWAIELGRFTNERPIPKRLQSAFLRYITKTWVSPTIDRRVYVEGVEWLLEHQPDRGVVLVSNHRSFFDMFIIMLSLWSLRADWIERMSFPVRSNFFYEHPLGIAMNLFIGGYCMYPPLFRDRSKAELNKDALARVAEMLQHPGNVVGLHPEGTRGKGPDPYELLRAQPGVGQIVLQARPLVVPLFINGLPNNLTRGLRDTYSAEARRDHPVIIIGGEPLDYSEFTHNKPRASLYLRCAGKMNQAIAALGEREKQVRAMCATGAIPDHDSRWLPNYVRERRRG